MEEIKPLHDIMTKEEMSKLISELENEYEAVQETSILNGKLVVKYENVLREIVEQRGLIKFLDENDWASTEDYFAHIARKALRD